MKVLVIQQRYGIGDMVIFLPYLKAISKKIDGSITLLAKESSKANELLFEENFLDEIIVLDKSKDGILGFFKLVKEIKSRRFDQVFIFNGSLRYKILSKLSGIKSIYQYPLFISKDIIFETAKNFIKKSLDINVATQPSIFLKPETIKAAKEKYNIDKNEKHLILGISASGPTKRWPIDNFIKLAQKLHEYGPCKFYIATGESDSDLNKILNSSVGKYCLSLSSLSIKEILPIIKNSNLYVGNDTGFMHISSALGIRCLGIFVDSPAYSYSAYSNNINVIVPEGETLQSTSHDTLGKDKISFEKVLSFSKKLLF
tara:strand:+ start:87 stop:1028 length:942 start_codon:yes stop_codon:yes gene_type:complete